ncbi:MAG: leucine-rich repeat domain-containing protein [Candidatus Hermodarchaeota archaeon]
MEFNPEKIFKNYNNHNLDKVSAIDQLSSLIENSDNISIRIESIEILERIGVGDDNVFNLFENLLISDSNDKVRIAAAKGLKNIFIDKALEPMKWALIHEESPSCLTVVYNTLINILKSLAIDDNRLTKLFFYNEVKKIRRKEFMIDFQIQCETKCFDDYPLQELVNIIVNYFTLLFLEKVYWRLKSNIERCTIIELDFIFKGLTTLPDAIANLLNLKKLILRYNQLFKLPKWIGSLKDLEILNINVNNLNKLPRSIGNLNCLKYLSLWKNELNELPSSIGFLKSLEYLNLRINNLKSLPETISNLKKLKELNLHDNKLEFLPNTIGSLQQLERLNLSWNNLVKIPESIGNIKSLQILDLERNELVHLPKSIGNLKSLKILNLSDNKIEYLPETIGSINSLQYLNISRNNLKKLPHSLLSLISLEELYIGDNKFNVASKIIEKLEKKGVQIFF